MKRSLLTTPFVMLAAAAGLVAVVGIQQPTAAEDTVGLVLPQTGEWLIRNGGYLDRFYFGNPGEYPPIVLSLLVPICPCLLGILGLASGLSRGAVSTDECPSIICPTEPRDRFWIIGRR